MKLEKYSMGIGDRFAQQGNAQLEALLLARKQGVLITPVWNKSFREHQIVHSTPSETRHAADAAVKEMQWDQAYFVDADHINMSNVDIFIEYCDFFTLDVADYIGKSDSPDNIQNFLDRNSDHLGNLNISGINKTFKISRELLLQIANKFLFAIKEAGKLYKHIESRKGKNNFITEVSMDEVNTAQSPIELFFILKELAAEGIPVATIAPKFSGRFNKGVEYKGNLTVFETEFEEYLCVIQAAKKLFKLPDELKLSIHSGSDKFSLYPIMGRLIRKYNLGIHLKTAGTTWLEELIGLAMAGEPSLIVAKNIYFNALSRFEELCAPYSTVIDVSIGKLPRPEEVKSWKADKFVNTLRHIANHPDYNPDFRQLMHVSYKIAAEHADKYLQHLKANKEIVGKQVTENLYERHIKKLFNL
jgi:hypothetical protein